MVSTMILKMLIFFHFLPIISHLQRYEENTSNSYSPCLGDFWLFLDLLIAAK